MRVADTTRNASATAIATPIFARENPAGTSESSDKNITLPHDNTPSTTARRTATRNSLNRTLSTSRGRTSRIAHLPMGRRAGGRRRRRADG